MCEVREYFNISRLIDGTIGKKGNHRKNFNGCWSHHKDHPKEDKERWRKFLFFATNKGTSFSLSLSFKILILVKYPFDNSSHSSFSLSKNAAAHALNVSNDYWLKFHREEEKISCKLTQSLLSCIFSTDRTELDDYSDWLNFWITFSL